MQNFYSSIVLGDSQKPGAVQKLRRPLYNFSNLRRSRRNVTPWGPMATTDQRKMSMVPEAQTICSFAKTAAVSRSVRQRELLLATTLYNLTSIANDLSRSFVPRFFLFRDNGTVVSHGQTRVRKSRLGIRQGMYDDHLLQSRNRHEEDGTFTS